MLVRHRLQKILMGAREFINKIRFTIISKRQQLLQHILKLSSLQSTWLLLCFYIVNHFLHIMPPNLVSYIVNDFFL